MRSRDPLDSVMVPPPDQEPDNSAIGLFCSARLKDADSSKAIVVATNATNVLQVCFNGVDFRAVPKTIKYHYSTIYAARTM